MMIVPCKCPACGWTGRLNLAALFENDPTPKCPDCGKEAKKLGSIRMTLGDVVAMNEIEVPDDTALRLATDRTLNGAVHAMDERRES